MCRSLPRQVLGFVARTCFDARGLTDDGRELLFPAEDVWQPLLELQALAVQHGGEGIVGGTINLLSSVGSATMDPHLRGQHGGARSLAWAGRDEADSCALFRLQGR